GWCGHVRWPRPAVCVHDRRPPSPGARSARGGRLKGCGDRGRGTGRLSSQSCASQGLAPDPGTAAAPVDAGDLPGAPPAAAARFDLAARGVARRRARRRPDPGLRPSAGGRHHPPSRRGGRRAAGMTSPPGSIRGGANRHRPPGPRPPARGPPPPPPRRGGRRADGMTSPPGSIRGGSNRHRPGVLLYRGDMNASDSDDPALTPESFLPGSLMSTFRERAVVPDRENTFPEDDLADLRARGYLRMVVPTELGGLGASLLQASRIQRRLAQASPATPLSMNRHLVVTAAALHAHRLGEDSGRLILEDAAADRLFAFGISEAGN